MSSASVRTECLNTIAAFPGITSGEIYNLIPHVNRHTVVTSLHSLYIEGKVLRENAPKLTTGRGRTFYKYTIAPEGTQPPAPRRKKAKQTQVGVDATIQILREEVSELRKWKEDAIARFPDLATDPVVITARKIVAHELRASGDNALADAVMHGMKDGTIMMRVTIAALYENA